MSFKILQNTNITKDTKSDLVIVHSAEKKNKHEIRVSNKNLELSKDIPYNEEGTLITQPWKEVKNVFLIDYMTDKALDKIVSVIKNTKAKTVIVSDIDFLNIDNFVMKSIYDSYEYGKDTDEIEFNLLNPSKTREFCIDDAEVIGNAVNFTRFLGDTPANVCTPEFLANQAMEIAQNNAIAKCKVITESEMKAMGAGAFDAISKGSILDGKLIVLEYMNGEHIDGEPVDVFAMVGKGVTFDTGGISLKPGNNMHEMKFDMLGAGTVFGAFKALSDMNAKVNVVMVVPAVENMPSAYACKPGDVVTSLSGQTIEILNTDAEGRMVLCDALTYVIRNYNPEKIIDVATLTGACVSALGNHATGLFSNDEFFVESIERSSKRTEEKVWRLPIWEEYDKQLESKVADFANIGTPGAGASTAACFLSRFTEGCSWAHLDIAGTAWKGGMATGVGVKLLVDNVLRSGI